MGEGPDYRGWYHSWVVVLGLIRVQVEQAIRSKTGSSTLPWHLYQLLPLVSYLAWVPLLVFFENELWYWSKLNNSFPSQVSLVMVIHWRHSNTTTKKCRIYGWFHLFHQLRSARGALMLGSFSGHAVTILPVCTVLKKRLTRKGLLLRKEIRKAEEVEINLNRCWM